MQINVAAKLLLQTVSRTDAKPPRLAPGRRDNAGDVGVLRDGIFIGEGNYSNYTAVKANIVEEEIANIAMGTRIKNALEEFAMTRSRSPKRIPARIAG